MITVHFKDLHKGQEDRLAEMANRYDSSGKLGKLTEDLMFDLFDQSAFRVKRAGEHVDYFFGSDGQLSWRSEGGHYSIHVDVTGAAKPGVEWLDYNGHVTDSPCFPYGGSNLRFAVGLKRHHNSGFSYRTPIYVLKVENRWLTHKKSYQAEFDFAVGALMKLHETSGRGKRASMLLDLEESYGTYAKQ